MKIVYPKLQYKQYFVFDALFLVLIAEKKDSGIVLSLTKEYQLASFVIEVEQSHRLDDLKRHFFPFIAFLALKLIKIPRFLARLFNVKKSS